jgi:hypothetical protein
MPKKVKINAHQGMTNSQLENSIILSFVKFRLVRLNTGQLKYTATENA